MFTKIYKYIRGMYTNLDKFNTYKVLNHKCLVPLSFVWYVILGRGWSWFATTSNALWLLVMFVF